MSYIRQKGVMSTTRSRITSKLGSGSRMIVSVLKAATWVRQARSIFPLITMPQDPQTADRQEERNESVPSISSRIRIRTASTVSPGMTRIR